MAENPDDKLYARVNKAFGDVVEASANRSLSRRQDIIMREFSDALADFKHQTEVEAMNAAAASYVPPVAQRNIAKWAVVNGGMTVQCDDNTFWLYSMDAWRQLPNVPGTVPE